MTEEMRAVGAVRAYQAHRAESGSRLPFAAIAAGGDGFRLSVRYGGGPEGIVSVQCASADEVEDHLATLAGDPD